MGTHLTASNAGHTQNSGSSIVDTASTSDLQHKVRTAVTQWHSVCLSNVSIRERYERSLRTFAATTVDFWHSLAQLRKVVCHFAPH